MNFHQILNKEFEETKIASDSTIWKVCLSSAAGSLSRQNQVNSSRQLFFGVAQIYGKMLFWWVPEPTPTMPDTLVDKNPYSESKIRSNSPKFSKIKFQIGKARIWILETLGPTTFSPTITLNHEGGKCEPLEGRMCFACQKWYSIPFSHQNGINHHKCHRCWILTFRVQYCLLF